MKIIRKLKTAFQIEKTLRFYASKENYDNFESSNENNYEKTEVEKDCGERASKTLDKLKSKKSESFMNELKSTLEFYANKSNYETQKKMHELSTIENDLGEKAQIALRNLNEIK